ncbi:MAG: hypothetical protein ABEJ42_09715 [Halobacteriaceae archaeon]
MTDGDETRLRRNVLKGILGAASLGGLPSIATANPEESEWIGATAHYRINATYDNGSSEVYYKSKVVDKHGSNIIIETINTNNGERSIHAVPTNAVNQPIRGETTNLRTGIEFIRNQSRNGGSVINGRIKNGWLESIHSQWVIDNRLIIDLSVELLEHSGGPNSSGSNIVLLPQIIPPDSRASYKSSSGMDVETTTQASSSQLSHYGYSTLVTKDNQVANLVTSKSDLQCIVDWTGSEYTNARGNVSTSTSVNWTKTGQSEYYSGGSKHGININFYGNFPAGFYTDWRNLHQHFFSWNTPFAYFRPVLYSDIDKRLPYSSWESHKSELWDGGNHYIGNRFRKRWYIL